MTKPTSNGNKNKNKKNIVKLGKKATRTHKCSSFSGEKHTKQSEQTGQNRPKHCSNPWNPECRSTDIALDIMHKGKQLPICRKCWVPLANSDREWGEAA